MCHPSSPSPTPADRGTSKPPEGAGHAEYALDGVRYATLAQEGRSWRAGAVTPTWRQELLSLTSQPGAEDLQRLGERGVWLAPADVPAEPLAVMCCGLGSTWPGMGRELYDTFPVAREAMDRLAALADWDLLGLMDETDPERINHTRWQCPYLFMLEFAQWSVLSSLGLQPSLICGHSLGELVGLCFAGVYTPEVAWYILDTRAVHMAELEAHATRETGMMAVHAEAQILQEVLSTWPSLYVSNYNTPRQCILSGPREVLLEARKSLRKRRIPAIMLNMSLAFHHPGMRVLRDMSLRRLNALAMHAPHFPMLSCITTDFYPDDQENVCRLIADLDENSVRWTECVEAMWQRDGIRVFLELGPQDTLCSLVDANRPDALCLTAGHKGHETEALRQACARLFALGYLHSDDVQRRSRAVSEAYDSSVGSKPPAPHVSPLPLIGTPTAQGSRDEKPAPVPDAETAGADSVSPASSAAQCLAVVTAAIARACGRQAEELRPEMDLRYDLSLRSSRFPLIVQDVEKALGRSISFERLLQVSTIGDLARVIAGETADQVAKAPPRPTTPSTGQRTPPLVRYAALETLPPKGTQVRLNALPLDPCGQGLPLASKDVLAVWTPHARLLVRLMRCLAPLGLVLAVPAALLEPCASLADLGAKLVPWDIPLSAKDAAGRITDAAALSKTCGRVDGLLFIPPEAGMPTVPYDAGEAEAVASLWHTLLSLFLPHGLKFACSCSVLPPLAQHCVFDGPLPAPTGLKTRHIRLLHGMEQAGLDEWGDMLARELLCGEADRVLWARPGTLYQTVVAPPPQKLRRDRPQSFPLAFMDPSPPYAPTPTLLQAYCHFSRFADPALNGHGGCEGERLGRDVPWLPASRVLEALLEGSRLALPWLVPTGFCDVRFYSWPELPPGVTRECRLAVEAEPWLMQDGTMTRLCRGQLHVQKLTSSGRHTGQYAPVAEGMTWLAAHSAAVPPLWNRLPEDAQNACVSTGTEGFYRIVGLDSCWRLATAFATLSDDMYSAVLRLPDAGIAPATNNGYTSSLLVMEGLLQATGLALTYRESAAFAKGDVVASTLRQWRLNGVGFLRFEADWTPGPVRLLLRRSWADGRLTRFDAQAADARQHIFLTAHHIEFARQDATAPLAVLS